MMFGPILPLVLLAAPVMVALGVLLAGVFGRLLGSRRELPAVPRAVARVVAPQPLAIARPARRASRFDEDAVTQIFDRRALAR